MNFNNSKLYTFLISALAIGVQQQSVAQNAAKDSILRTQTFDIYQIYVPEVQKKTKERLFPDLPKIDTINPVYTYIVPEQKLSYSYQAAPLRPLALGIEQQEQMMDNYVKAGFGNYRSILLDAGISSLQTKNFQSIIHASHLSQKGGEILNRQRSVTSLSAKGYTQYKKHDIVGDLNFDRVGVAYYGLRPDTIVETPFLDDVRQVYWGVNGKIGVENNALSAFRYQPSISVGYYADRYEANETSVKLNVPLSYTIDSSIKVGFDVNGDFNQYVLRGNSTSNNAFQIHPYVKFDAFKSNFNIGVKPTWGSNNKFYFLPDITAQIGLVPNKLKLNGGFKGELVQNTFRQMSTKNPFLHQYDNILQTRQLKVFGGFDANITENLTLGGSISWNNWTNLPVFVNDYSKTFDGRHFKVIHDAKVTGLMFDGYIKYQISENFGLIGSGAWTSFTEKSILDKIYHEPLFKIGGEIFAKPIKGLNISAKFEYWDRIFYLKPDNTSQKLKPITDLSFVGEYQIIPRLSAFIQLNNILNNQYNRWYHYDAYGFNIIGGLRYKF